MARHSTRANLGTLLAPGCGARALRALAFLAALGGAHRPFTAHVLGGAPIGDKPSTIAAQAERAFAFWPNRGEADGRPPLGEPYRRVDPVPAVGAYGSPPVGKRHLTPMPVQPSIESSGRRQR